MKILKTEKSDFRKILGVRVDSTSTSRVLTQIQKKLLQGRKFYITTPNPEIVLKASKDRKLRDIIGRSFLAIPDGVGLQIALKFLSMSKFSNRIVRKVVYPLQLLLSVILGRKNVVKGRELMLNLFGLTNQKKLKVYLLGATKSVNAKAIDKFRNEYSGAKIKGSSGPELNSNAKPLGKLQEKLNREAVEEINRFAPSMLFVAFGCPKQEKWIAKWLPRLNVKMAMTVGGALDYYAGVAKIPPKWMVRVGLEWLWRLIKPSYYQPRKRFYRIVNSVIVFPWKIFVYKLQNPKT